MPDTNKEHSKGKYKSAEEKIGRKVKEISKYPLDFIKSGIPTLYRIVAAPFRIPTSIRKIANSQSNIQRILNGEKEYTEYSTGDLGQFTFGIAGIATDFIGGINLIKYCMESQDYAPLAILGLTNLASGIYELGRLKQSKQEHKKALEKKISY